jgi:hypothetical protein
MRGLYTENYSSFIDNSPPNVGSTPLGVRVFSDDYDAYCLDLMSVDEMSPLPDFGGFFCPDFFEELIFMRCSLELNKDKQLIDNIRKTITYIADRIFICNPMKKGLPHHQYIDAVIAYSLESGTEEMVLIDRVFKSARLRTSHHR